MKKAQDNARRQHHQSDPNGADWRQKTEEALKKMVEQDNKYTTDITAETQLRVVKFVNSTPESVHRELVNAVRKTDLARLLSGAKIQAVVGDSNVLDFFRACSRNPIHININSFVRCGTLIKEPNLELNNKLAKFFCRFIIFATLTSFLLFILEYLHAYPAEAPFCMTMLAHADLPISAIKATVHAAFSEIGHAAVAELIIEKMKGFAQIMSSLALPSEGDAPFTLGYFGTTISPTPEKWAAANAKLSGQSCITNILNHIETNDFESLTGKDTI